MGHLETTQRTCRVVSPMSASQLITGLTLVSTSGSNLEA
eukprot:CAMPEP_0203943696 /NCGR_PEP_ID=MMETSP0359-20131031/79612_1 /ASSEMBLY_ACC=CAM_ASM_000338 /TAXON_ID=268821 /ORGANISM="Scrippsiella Hangoei, Strain SHTV-5" /LENGTH=38 /DNA_ID= /DNA_START= /DNA_END= /DNA_ORIENTATION=